MPTTPIHGLRSPALTDSANGPLAVGNLASDVEGKLQKVRSGQGALFGTSPPSDKSMIIKAYTTTVTTNSNGDATHGYIGGAFPNGVLSVVASSGDVVAGGHTYMAVISTPNLSNVNTRHFKADGSVVANLTVRANVIAVGW